LRPGDGAVRRLRSKADAVHHLTVPAALVQLDGLLTRASDAIGRERMVFPVSGAAASSAFRD